VAFRKATKHQQKLRLAISGPAGSGKTYTQLLLAKHLGQRIAVIDTERGSASKYAGDVADFDVVELEVFAVHAYLDAIADARRGGYDVLAVDSLSHAWSGRGGILEEVDKRGGKFDAWRHATPLQQKLVDALLTFPGHVICTMRSKMDYQVTTVERQGKRETKVEKLGLAPVQRDDLPYEFDVWLDMNERHIATVSKSRCAALSGVTIERPGQELAETLKAWLSDGAPMLSGAADTRAPATVTATRARGNVDEYGLTMPESACPVFSRPDQQNYGKRWDEVPPALIQKMLQEHHDRMSAPQLEWAEYLSARRTIRKEREALSLVGAEHERDIKPSNGQEVA